MYVYLFRLEYNYAGRTQSIYISCTPLVETYLPPLTTPSLPAVCTENLDTCDDVGSIGACSLDTDTTGSITLTSSDSRSHGDGRSRDFEHHVEYTSPTSPISPTTTTASYPTTYS